MKEFTRSVQVIETWTVSIEAETTEEVNAQLNRLTASQIRADGSLKAVDVDYAEQGEENANGNAQD